MRMRKGFLTTLTVLAVLLGVFVNSASARLWTLQNGLDTVKIEDAVNPTTGVSLGMSYWTMNGSTLDRVYQQAFWYSVGYTAPKALDALPVSSTKAYVSTPITTPAPPNVPLTYTDTEFAVTVDYILTGATTTTKTSKLTKRVTIKNLTAAPLEYHFYHYSDFDVRYTPAKGATPRYDYDSAAVRGGKAYQTSFTGTAPDGTTVVQTATLPATQAGVAVDGYYAIMYFEDPLNEVPLDVDSAFTGPNLDYNTYEISPGEEQFIMQWDLNIPANGTVSFDIVDNVYPSKPVVVQRTFNGTCATSGQSVTYNLCFDNTINPTLALTNAQIEYALGDTTFVSASDSGVYDSGMNKVTWSIGNVAANAPQRCVSVTASSNQPVSVHDFSVWSDQTFPGFVREEITLCAGSNPPIILSGMPPSTADEGILYTYQVSATDPDGDPLYYSFDSSPVGMTISPAGLVTWTPGQGQSGLFNVTIRVSDGTLFTTQSYTINTKAVDRPPIISSTPVTSAKEGVLYQYQIQAADPEGGRLYYAVLGGPVGLTVGSTTGLVSWTPQPGSAAPHRVLLGVRDVALNEVTQEYTITVTPNIVNNPPRITSTPPVNATENIYYSYQVIAVDADTGDTVGYSLLNAPIGMMINNTTGQITWVPSYSQAGLYSVTVVAIDSAGASVQQNYNISVVNVNRVPEFTSTPIMSVDIQTAYSYKAVATDPDLETIIGYGLSAAPTGMSINTSTGQITWTPTTAGPVTVTVTATDAVGGVGSQTFTLIVYDPRSTNVPPTITSTAPTAPVEEGGSYMYRVTATDPGDVLSYSLAAGYPAGLIINKTTGLITWLPNYLSVGVWNVSVIVSDSKGGTATQSFKITVTNIPPMFTSTPVVTGDDTVTYSYSATATDVGDAPVVLSLVSPPAGMEINYQGIISWANAVPGKYTINVRASDGYSVVTQTYTLTITHVNQAPIFTSGAPAAGTYEGSTFVYDVNASDPNGDAVTYSLAPGAPVGMTINSSTGAITWPTTYANVGTSTVTVNVTDGSLVASQVFNVVVTELAPVFKSAPISTGSAGNPYTYTAVATDPGGAVVTYTVVTTAIGLTINKTTGVVSWATPVAGAYAVTISASDGKITTNQGYTLTIGGLNLPPQISTTAPTASVNEGSLFSYDVNATDGNNDVLTYTLGAGAPSTMSINTTSGLINWTPMAANVGSVPVTVNVADGNGGTASQTFTVTVNNVVPVFTSTPIATWSEGTAYSYTAAATDAGGAAITYTLAAGPTGMTINNGVVSWAVPLAGSYAVTINASDGRATVAQAYTLTVNPVGGPAVAPVIISTAPTAAVIEASAYTYDVNATDANGDVLTYSLGAGFPSGMTINATTGVIAWTPAYTQAGIYTVKVRATDPGALFAEQTFTVTVLDVDRPPVITSTPSNTATEGFPYSYQVVATDPDANPLTYTLTTFPAGMTISAAGTIGWTPTAAQGGANAVVVSVKGASLATTQSFTITVTTFAHLPTITSTPSTSATVGAAYSYQVVATDPDAGTVITYGFQTTPTAPPAGMSINPTTGMVTWTPTAAGTFPVTVTATDNTGLVASQSFSVVVGTGGNVAPVITSTGCPTATVGQPYSCQVVATDANGNPLTYSLTTKPAGMVISATGLITWTPSAAGANAVTVSVSDGTLSTSQSFTVTVADPPNKPPVISSTAITTGTAGQAYSYQVAAADPEGSALIYTLTTKPAGMAISTTGLITWTPTASGAYNVVISVSDGSLSATQSYTLTIGAALNNAPSITSAAVLTATEGLAYAYAFRATDPDAGDVLTYSLPVAPAGMTINSTTGAISWTPDYTQSGNRNVTARATDKAGLFADQVFVIAVANVDRVPTITSTAPTAATTGVAYSYQVAANDPDGDALTYSLTTPPAGMTISPAGLISWTPSATGAFPVTMTVKGSTLAATQAFTINVTVAPNVAPTITSTAVTTATEGSAYSYDVAATDANAGDVLTYSLTASPAGMTINATTGLIGWTPDFTQSGNQSVTVRVTDKAGLFAQQSFTIVVANVNRAPAFTSTPVITGTVGKAYTYTAVAVDPDGTAVTYSLTTRPPGMTINATTGVITWTPTSNQTGARAVSVRASDGTANVTQSFSVNVTTNQAPTISSAAVTMATVSTPYIYQVVAADPNGDALTYSLTTRPTGMTISAAGLVSWTPTATGSNIVTVSVSDGSLSGTQTFTVTVAAGANRAPSITSTAVTTAKENTAYTYTVTATDPDAGDAVTLSLPVSPAGMTINATTGVITWTPSYTQSGNQNVTVRATDKGGLTVDQTFVVAVANTDRAPSITSTAVTTATQGAAYSYLVAATDPDGDVITFALTAPPAGMTINASTGLINWMPSATGAFNVTVTATAGTLSATQNFTITVAAPVNRAPSITSTAVATAAENAAYSYTVTATDPDAGDAVTFTLPVAPVGMTINATTGVISWTPSYTQSGNQNVTVRATDKGGLTADQTFVVAVANTDRAPSITSTAVTTATQGAAYSYLVAAGDPDGDAITFALTAPPAGMTINASTGLINWTPSATGAFNVTVTATAGTLSATQNFTITVAAPANRAPSITSTAVATAAENAAYSYTVTATDPDAGDAVTFSLPVAPAGMTINATTGVISWTPSYTQSGNQNVTVRATDKGGLTASQSFIVVVGNVDRAPSITSSAVTTANQGMAYSYLVAASDPDGDAITFALAGAPAGMTINAGTGLINWTPSAAGTFNVTVTATSGTLSATQSFTITVAAVAVDTPPVITSTAPTAGVAGIPYAYQVTANDPEGKALTYSLTVTQTGMTINATSGLISWTPTTSQTGARSVTVRATDGTLATTQSFTITVAANQSPVITSTAVTTATANRAYSYQVVASDPEGRTLTYSLTTRPSGMTISSATGLISWTPTSTGSYSVTVSVTDGVSTARTQSYTLNVISNQAPRITSTAPTSATVGKLYTYQVVATDANNDNLTYSLTTTQTGMTINSSTGLISWTPTSSQTGSRSVAVRVSDGSLTASQSFSINVVANSAPVISSTAVTSAVVNTPYSYDVTATDVNNDTLTYSLTTAPADMTIDPATGLISWTPTAAGANSVTVSVSDGALSRTQSFTINVTQFANQAPFITSTAPTVATAGKLYTYQVVASDPEGSALTYSLTTTQTGMTINASTGLISWTPTSSQTGSRSVAVRVSDGSLTASQSFTITVAANTTPTITSTALTTATVNKQYSYQVVATDPDGNTLTYSLPTRPSGMTISSTTGLITWTPTETGSNSVTVSVSDGLASRTQSFTINVVTNQAPRITSLAPTVALVGQLYSYQVVATDANNDTLTYSLTTTQTGMTINSATGLISWTPSSSQTGSRSVAVRVSDGSLTASQSFTVTVRTTNAAPVITTTSLPSATAGSSYSRTMTATDSNNDPLRWSLTTAPAGMTISTSGTISWNPTTAQRGTHTVTVAVTDTLAITTRTYSITVN